MVFCECNNASVNSAIACKPVLHVFEVAYPLLYRLEYYISQSGIKQQQAILEGECTAVYNPTIPYDMRTHRLFSLVSVLRKINIREVMEATTNAFS